MGKVLEQHIVKTPGVCGGKACVAGTRIRVQDIFIWHELQQKSVATIVADFPQLFKADVHAALAYYWDNRDEIMGQMAAEDALVQEMKARMPSQLKPKLAAKGNCG